MDQPNSMYFVNAEDALAFVAELNKLSLKTFDDDRHFCLYNDIHMYPEEGAIIVEWIQVPFDHEWGGQFKYIADNQVVMIEKIFPDNHIEYFADEKEAEEAFEEWYKDNPEEE